jgi:hypothetical protein
MDLSKLDIHVKVVRVPLALPTRVRAGTRRAAGRACRHMTGRTGTPHHLEVVDPALALGYSLRLGLNLARSSAGCLISFCKQILAVALAHHDPLGARQAGQREDLGRVAAVVQVRQDLGRRRPEILFERKKQYWLAPSAEHPCRPERESYLEDMDPGMWRTDR